MQDLLQVLRVAEKSEETLMELHGDPRGRNAVRVGPSGGFRWGHRVGRVAA